jgi:tRNA 2-selenouridine synthase
MFENKLATQISRLREEFSDRPIWIEDESQRIGDVNIPTPFFHSLREAKRAHLDVPFEQRLDNIVSEYGALKTEGLINAIVRIKKRLGPLETKTAIAHLIERDVKECFRILLRYYDKHYPNGQEEADRFEGAGRGEEEIAELIKIHYS